MIQDITHQFSQQDIESNKIMAILCYVGAFIIVPIIMAKDSPYVKQNINQGGIVCIASIALNMLSGFLMFVPFGNIFAVVVNFVVCSVALTAIINIVLGKAIKFPYIGDIELMK